jgi:excisionase family DNA binding protein
MTEEKEMLTTLEAAKMLGRTDRQVRRYCQEGELDSIRNGKQILISPDSLEHLQGKLHPDQVEPAPEQEPVPEPVHEPLKKQEVRSIQTVRNRLSAGIQQLWTGFFTRRKRDHIIADLEYRLKVENERNEKIQDELLALVQQLRSHPVEYERQAFVPMAQSRRLWKWVIWIGIVVGLFFWLVY